MIAFAIVWQTFSATVNAWKRGGELLDELRHGDFVMEQLVSALRSTAYFPTARDKYGFRLKSGSQGYPADRISWVTSGTAFMKPDSPLINGLHRLVFSIENNKDGDTAVAIRAYPPLMKDVEESDIDPWYVSTEVKGIQCRTYNSEDEDWENEWEDTNAIPSLVEITLYMDPIEKYGEPIQLKRVVVIPVAPAVSNAVVATPSQGGSEAAPTSSGSTTNAASTREKGGIISREDGAISGVTGGEH